MEKNKTIRIGRQLRHPSLTNDVIKFPSESDACFLTGLNFNSSVPDPGVGWAHLNLLSLACSDLFGRHQPQRLKAEGTREKQKMAIRNQRWFFFCC